MKKDAIEIILYAEENEIAIWLNGVQELMLS